MIDIGRECQSLKKRKFERFQTKSVIERFPFNQNNSSAYNSDSYLYQKDENLQKHPTNNKSFYCDTKSFFLVPENKKSEKKQKRLDFKSFCNFL